MRRAIVGFLAALVCLMAGNPLLAKEAAPLALATAGEHGVLVFGSLYLASAVRPVMMEALKKN